MINSNETGNIPIKSIQSASSPEGVPLQVEPLSSLIM